MLHWVVILHETGEILGVVFGKIDESKVGDVSWLWFEEFCGWGFPGSDDRGLGEIELNHGKEFAEVRLKASVVEIHILGLWLNKVQDSFEALVSLKELRASNIVVTTSESRINSNALRFRVDLQLHSSNTIEPSNSIDLGPWSKMDDALQSWNIIESWQWSDESALSGNYDLWALTQHTFLDESVDGESERASVSFGISGKGAHVRGEGKTAADEIQEHEVCNIGEFIRVGGESKISV